MPTCVLLRSISMLPLKYAPSSIMTRAVERSPTTEPSFLISMRSRAEIAIHFAGDDHFAGDYFGSHFSAAADGQLVAPERDRPFHLAFDMQVLIAGDFALYAQGRP